MRVYPRVCGGTLEEPDAQRRDAGLSPRVRGNREFPRPAVDDGGSIPACAGEPWRNLMRKDAMPVYPRVCGGTGSSRARLWMTAGLSPRVRGNRGGRRPVAAGGGSIPACAGEPR